MSPEDVAKNKPADTAAGDSPGESVPKVDPALVKTPSDKGTAKPRTRGPRQTGSKIAKPTDGNEKRPDRTAPPDGLTNPPTIKTPSEVVIDRSRPNPGSGNRPGDPTPPREDLGPRRSRRPIDDKTRELITDLDKSNSKLRIPTRLPRNGDLRLDDLQPEVRPELDRQLRKIQQARNDEDLRQQLQNLERETRLHPEYKRLNLDRSAGLFQSRVDNRMYLKLERSSLGERLNLQRQFDLYRRGDVARQLRLTDRLYDTGWGQRPYQGRIARSFVPTSFSFWYAGPRYYPRHCWLPRWTRWVDWTWWSYCGPLYDPRPAYCRPVVLAPCPAWTYAPPPRWAPLPVVACGTWVDLPPVAPVAPVAPVMGQDLQLTAVRFVDGGHPDQELGPRFRIWVRNTSPTPVVGSFNVLLIGGETEDLQPELPQAGVIVPNLETNETRAVDIRLPYEAMRLTALPDGKRGMFEFLHIMVDSHQQIAETSEENNGAVIPRQEVLPVDPASFSSDSQTAAPGALVSIAGEGFGPEPGQVMVVANGLQVEAEIFGWYDLGVRFKVPELSVAGATTTEVLVVRGDGAAANPISLEIAPASTLGPAPPPDPMLDSEY